MIRLETRPASELAIASIRLYGGGFLTYGLVIALQGPQRWSSSATLASATNLMRPWQWGAAFVVLGALILLGHYTYRFILRNVGMYGASLLLGFLGVTAIHAAYNNPAASFAGGVFYAVVALALLPLARAREVKPHVGSPQVS